MGFYRDLKDKRVERLAKAMCAARGIDADTLVDDSGYSDAPTIPAWWKMQDFAVNFLACLSAAPQNDPPHCSRFRASRNGWIVDSVTGLHITRVAVEVLDDVTAQRAITTIIAALHADFGPSDPA